jgi:hypothetical protein
LVLVLLALLGGAHRGEKFTAGAFPQELPPLGRSQIVGGAFLEEFALVLAKVEFAHEGGSPLSVGLSMVTAASGLAQLAGSL